MAANVTVDMDVGDDVDKHESDRSCGDSQRKRTSLHRATNKKLCKKTQELFKAFIGQVESSHLRAAEKVLPEEIMRELLAVNESIRADLSSRAREDISKLQQGGI